MPATSREVARGGGAVRQLAAGRGRAAARGRDARAPDSPGAVPVARPAAPTWPTCGPRSPRTKGRRRGRQDDRPLRTRRRAGLHAARPGQRRGGGAPGHRRARRRRVPLRDGLRRGDRRPHHRRPRDPLARSSTSPAPRPSSTRTSTRPRRWRRRPCCTSSAPWSPTTSRSTTAACVRCGSSSRPARCSRPTYPAAVVAGNVETSQAITGALYAALRRAGRGLGHDEQRHLRQRAPPVLRDRRLRLRARVTGSTGRPWCRRT